MLQDAPISFTVEGAKCAAQDAQRKLLTSLCGLGVLCGEIWVITSIRCSVEFHVGRNLAQIAVSLDSKVEIKMCIQNKPRLGFLFVVMLLTTVIVLAAGCTDSEPTEENAPLYTPIVILPESTDLPTETTLISLEELSAQPEKYADRFVEVHGLNAGIYARPDCSPYIGPPTEWLLFARAPGSSQRSPSTARPTVVRCCRSPCLRATSC